jgi:hypothetical protein
MAYSLTESACLCVLASLNVHVFLIRGKAATQTMTLPPSLIPPPLASWSPQRSVDSSQRRRRRPRSSSRGRRPLSPPQCEVDPTGTAGAIAVGAASTKLDQLQALLAEPVVDLWALRALAITPGGLVNGTLMRVWSEPNVGRI